jgi:hypothetical protein
MMKAVSAKLRWMRPDEGGRKTPPPGPRIVMVPLFEQQRETWLKEAWSMVIEWNEAPDASRTHNVNLRFLVNGAPDHLLTTGNRFELLEGNLIVAIGEIL